MVHIEPFEVEQWMDDHEHNCKYNIAETCSASISIADLQSLSDDKESNPLASSHSKKMTYGSIRGSDALRSNLARLYSTKVTTPLPKENILITPGAIAANYLVFYTLIKPGDHVICHYPTYAQLYKVPASLGAEVSLWKATPENSWIPRIEDLEQLIQPGKTTLLVLNTPNNPTGAVLPKSLMQSIVDLASKHNITILSDEVYRPLFHGITPASPDFLPSNLSLGYKNTIVTGSLSKAYGLAGIRVGWIASRSPEIIEACAQARHYTTISVSQLDDAVAAFALSPATIHNLLGRNIQLARGNLEMLDRWIAKYDDQVEYVRPVAGTTAFVKFHRDGRPVDGVRFCEMLLEKVGVLFVPGESCFGKEWKGYVRIGFVQESEVLREALEKMKGFMKRDFDDVPLASEG